MHRKVFLALVVVCCLAQAAYAIPTITAGSWTINPAAGQSVDAITAMPIAVMAGGGDAIAGVDLATNVGGGVMMSLVDIIGPGTIFSASNTGVTEFFPGVSADKYTITTTVAGTLPALGVLAYVTFDATGVLPGIYPFSLFNFVGPSDLPPFATPFLVSGSVTVIPEPGSIVLALFAAGGLCAVAIRRRRKLA